MPEAETGQAVQVLGLLLEYFGERGKRWTRDRYDDGDVTSVPLGTSPGHASPSARASANNTGRLASETTVRASPGHSSVVASLTCSGGRNGFSHDASNEGVLIALLVAAVTRGGAQGPAGAPMSGCMERSRIMKENSPLIRNGFTFA
jgi:hypothetical protein